jgi:glutaredoxin
VRKVTLYTRVECCLCDEAKAVLDEVRRTDPFELEIVDIDRDPPSLALYTHEVPVIAIDGRKAFKFHVTADQLREKLARRAP